MKRTSTPTVRIHLENRTNKDGTHPISLRVTYERKSRYFRLYKNLTQEDWDHTWKTRDPKTKPRKEANRKKWQELRKLREELEDQQREAEEVIRSLEHFSFEAFKEQFFGKEEESPKDVFSLFEQKIDKLKKEERLKTSTACRTSMNKFKKYLEKRKGRIPKTLAFEDVTPEFLEDFNRWMTKEEGCAQASVGAYVRDLKAIINEARELGMTENYPFGKRKYQPPQTRRTKKALSSEELKTLSDAEPRKEEERRAKDLFFLSFFLQGVNLKDLAYIRNKDIDENNLRFFRAKTKDTNKEPIEVNVSLTEKSRNLLEKYRGNDQRPEAPFLDIISKNDSPAEAQRKIDNTDRFINQHLKPFAKAHGVTEEISFIWARHTYSNLSVVEGGAKLEFVSKALGHSDIKTTQAYFAGFPQEQQREINEKLQRDL